MVRLSFRRSFFSAVFFVASPPPESGPALPGVSSRSIAGRRVKRWIIPILAGMGIAAISHIWYRGSHIDDRVYSAELDRGPISQIISWDGGRNAVQISRLSALPADDLWRVVTDQGRFDEFMPYVRTTTVRPGPDDALIESQILDLPHASYELELTIRLREEGDKRTAGWVQTKGILPYNQGAWVVERYGKQSILRYQVSAALSGVPQWIVNFAMRRRLGRLLEAVETRVRELQNREPDYFRS
jgi:Polyketide cyclase / dehydrase and lipid transport